MFLEFFLPFPCLTERAKILSLTRLELLIPAPPSYNIVLTNLWISMLFFLNQLEIHRSIVTIILYLRNISGSARVSPSPNSTTDVTKTDFPEETLLVRHVLEADKAFTGVQHSHFYAPEDFVTQRMLDLPYSAQKM
jgi:hypothetical protein